MKSTRKSLWASGLALLVCVALLIGTTFAWFTDSVTNKGNKIQAGSLDVSLAVFDEAKGGYDVITDSSDPIFNYTNWEPGYTELAAVKIGNEGTLALKYQLDLIRTGTVEDGKKDLAEVIEVYYLPDYNAVTAGGLPTRIEDCGTYMGTIAEVMNGKNSIANGHIVESGTADFALIALHMPTTVANDYQGGSIGGTFDIQLKATQYTSETDGFGNSNYDEGALYPVTTTISDISSLQEALNISGVPVELNVTNNLVSRSLEVTGNVTLNLGLNMLSSSEYSHISGTDVSVQNGGSLTLNAEANSYGFDYTAAQLTSEGEGTLLTVNGGRYGDSGASSNQSSAKDGAVLILNDGIFSSSGAYAHVVTASNGGTVYVNGGRYSSSGYQSIVIYADGGTVIVENCEFGGVNGKRFGVANGGQILVSKTASPSKPTSIADGCAVTDNGDGYWLITEQ